MFRTFLEEAAYLGNGRITVAGDKTQTSFHCSEEKLTIAK
jgi:hypothetical protein